MLSDYRRFWKCILLTVPMAVGAEIAPDSSSTLLKVTGGGGDIALVIRDCDGNAISSTRHEYANVGAELKHQLTGEFEVGVKGGYLDGSGEFEASDDNAFFYGNPYFAIEPHWFGIGFGAFLAEKPVLNSPEELDSDAWWSGHLRLGPPSVHFSTSYMENLPLYTGGYVDVGVGHRFEGGSYFWLGVGFPGPYDHSGLLTKLDLTIEKRFQLNFMGRVGSSEGITEYGLGLGFSYIHGWK